MTTQYTRLDVVTVLRETSTRFEFEVAHAEAVWVDKADVLHAVRVRVGQRNIGVMVREGVLQTMRIAVG